MTPTARHVVRGSFLLASIIAAALWPTASWAAQVSVIEDIDFGESVQFVAAPGEANDLEHSEAGGVVIIRDPGAGLVPGAGCIAIDAHEVRCTPVSVSRFGPTGILLRDRDDAATILSDRAFVSGGDGEDDLSACDPCRVTLAGDAGNDTISGGGGRFGGLEGGEGDDVIAGGSQADWIAGGPGNDTIGGGGGYDQIEPGPGSDVVDGGAGDDSILFRFWGPGVSVDLRAGTASGQGTDTLLGLEIVYGTTNADRLVGNAEDNFLNGFNGSDILIGGRGDDGLYGGEGTQSRGRKDRLWGGPGNDRLQGIDGDDLLVGGDGRDSLLGGSGADRFGARDGTRDRVGGGTGVDRGRFDRGLDNVAGVEIRL
jgi:Ca2+-binding RTX toxin-like protein